MGTGLGGGERGWEVISMLSFDNRTTVNAAGLQRGLRNWRKLGRRFPLTGLFGRDFESAPARPTFEWLVNR